MHDESMVITTNRASVLLLVWVSLMLLGAMEVAADTKVGTFSVIRGEVDALHEQSSSPVPALKDSDAFMNDMIRTKRRSRARLSFTDGSVLNMGANHMVNVKEYAYDEEKEIRRVVVNVLRGSIRATVAKFAGDSVFEVETPTAVIAVRGTDFIIKVGPDGTTTVTVISGTVLVKNEFGTVTLQAGQQSTTKKGEAPSAPIKVSKAMMDVLTEETKVEALTTTTTSSAATVSTKAETQAAVSKMYDAIIAAGESEDVAVAAKEAATKVLNDGGSAAEATEAALLAAETEGSDGTAVRVASDEAFQDLIQPISDIDPSASSALVSVPEEIFQKVNTGSQQQDIINIQQKVGNNAAGWTFSTPPITQTITNLQGCPNGTIWQQAASSCSVGGGVCGGAGTACNQGVCLLAPAICFISGGGCTVGGAACPGGGGDICTPIGPDLCSSNGAICPTPGAACGGGICVAGAFGCQ